MHKEEASCICQCGFEVIGRSIWFVTMDEGKLGIMMKDANSAAVLPINPSLPGMSEANAPRVILGTMGLLAAVKTWDQPTLIACFETALVMTIVENEKEQREMLLCIYSEERVEQILTSAWAKATELAAQVFSYADRELVTNLYIFSFCDSSAIRH